MSGKPSIIITNITHGIISGTLQYYLVPYVVYCGGQAQMCSNVLIGFGLVIKYS